MPFHVPTSTTHRITYTYDKASDETFPHISADGTQIIFEAKSHYYENVDGSHDTNRDIWMTRLFPPAKQTTAYITGCNKIHTRRIDI